MKKSKRILSMLLAICMVMSMMPATVFAGGADEVYLSVSYDGKYIADANGDLMAYVPISMDEISTIDLDAYGLGEYVYDEDGDGSNDITVLHLVIYAHENIYGGDWSEVTFTGAPGSSYFQGGIFGFDENLNYYLNGEYPLASAGWGATSDQIVIEAGDYLDIGSFSSWDFYADSYYGFHFFADANGDFTHAYDAEAETPLTVKLVRSYSAMGSGEAVYDEAGYEVFYGTTLYDAAGSVITDDSGCAEITFPTGGTWYVWADGGYGCEFPMSIVSSPAYAEVTVKTKEAETTPDESEPDEPREAQSVASVLNKTMSKMASTVTAPSFGTSAGEWTVFALARGSYYEKDSDYFADYYDRIVSTVNTTAASVNMAGALHKNKSTENSRLIVALSALGKDATSVGNWDLVEPYSTNGLSWIKKQGLNGTIWALIALDSNNYETSDETIRQQCIDAILAAQHDDGGWSLSANTTFASDPDVTGMALTALYPYSSQSAVKEACAEAITCLSEMQHENGTFASGGSECAESCAWVIVATTTWGINPDTDSRFIKNGKSVVDGLLAHYQSNSDTFQHIIGAGSNDMAIDQSCYALVAYDRLLDGDCALFDYSDVDFEGGSGGSTGSEGSDVPTTPDEPKEPTDEQTPTLKAKLGLPAQIENTVGTKFNAIISVDNWDNNAKLKLIDFLMTVPDGLKVTDVTAGDRLFGGSVSYHTDENGNLRCVYFDANENKDLTVSGTEFPAELFTVSFEVTKKLTAESLSISMEGMSVKLSSDSSDKNAMIVVSTTTVTDPDDPDGGTDDDGSGDIGVVTGVSFSAAELYTGDDIDLIPSTKKAVAIAVTGVDPFSTLVYDDGTNEIQFQYSDEITNKTKIATFVALVDAEIDTKNFINEDYLTINADGVDQSNITFSDSNDDGVVNAQDALAAVDTWLRKGDAPTDDEILRINVNGDSRINTFDALGIVEAFVNSSTYGVVTKAAILASK